MSEKKVLMIRPGSDPQAVFPEHFGDNNVALEAVYDGDKALAQVTSGDYHLIIADLDTPVVQSLPLLQRIKLRRPGTPVIVFSSFSSLQNQATALRSGAEAFYSKPLSPFDLRRAVQRWIM